RTGSEAGNLGLGLHSRDRLPHLHVADLYRSGGDCAARCAPSAGGNQQQKLRMMPGERADLIIDFAGFTPGTLLLLRNNAKSPYPAGDTVNGSTVGRILQFRVVPGSGTDTTYDPALGGALRTPMVRLADPVAGTLAPGVV